MADRRKDAPPFDHDILETGYCSSDCDACRWYRVRALAAREALHYPPTAVVLSDDDTKFLHNAQITWSGDTR
jgi:hypothetical protein